MAARRPCGSRRALGDIGNIVGSIPTVYVVAAKGQRQQRSLQSNQIRNGNKFNGPITRYGAQVASRNKENVMVVNDKDYPEAKENRSASSKRKRRRSQEDDKIGVGPAMEKEKEQETQNEILERRECECSSGSSMSMETADSTLDSNADLNEVCEVEMEEAESPLRWIDKSDSKNPLAVVEYVDDIYNFYHKTEVNSCVPPDYMSNQIDINHRMRAILIDWLIEVHRKFELEGETLFLAINLIDRYLCRQSIMRKYLQLVGITGMLLACKYEEVAIPLLDDFIYITDRAYTKDDVLKMEKSMLNVLQYKIFVPTPYVFMRRFLKAAEFDTKLEMASSYLVELCMVEYQMLKFPPSLLSASAVYAGRCLLKRTPAWDRTLVHYSTYSEEQLQECVRLMVVLHENAAQGRLTAVHKKYSLAKYSCISLLLRKC